MVPFLIASFYFTPECFIVFVYGNLSHSFLKIYVWILVFFYTFINSIVKFQFSDSLFLECRNTIEFCIEFASNSNTQQNFEFPVYVFMSPKNKNYFTFFLSNIYTFNKLHYHIEQDFQYNVIDLTTVASFSCALSQGRVFEISSLSMVVAGGFLFLFISSSFEHLLVANTFSVSFDIIIQVCLLSFINVVNYLDDFQMLFQPYHPEITLRFNMIVFVYSYCTYAYEAYWSLIICHICLRVHIQNCLFPFFFFLKDSKLFCFISP